MPLVAHSSLPTFARLREQGQEVVPLDRALHQDIRELHIGLLNMMPDAALAATERQFMRLVGNSNQIAQFYVHPFSLPVLPRSPQGRAYIAKHYNTFDDIKRRGLDALIITGANVVNPTLEQEPFWEPLMEVATWAHDHIASTLCSCLATHALLRHKYGIERRPLANKRWGVYNHRITHVDHPLLRNINTRFDAPHSRNNGISRYQMEAAGLPILVESRKAGVHLAVSRDGFRTVYFQGHPEYDIESLLKEYKREVSRFLLGDRPDRPPHPINYFSPEAGEMAERYIDAALLAREWGDPLPLFPEAEIRPFLDNTWGDTGKAIVNNWLGLVYKLTNHDRAKQFMAGVDADDPLGLRKQSTIN